MFTGIIKEIGTIKKKKVLHSGGVIFTIGTKKIHPRKSESIAINGVCLTVTETFSGSFIVEVISETLKRTNFSELVKGDAINLEPSMKLSDLVSGHFVLGHADATGKIIAIKTHGNETTLTIQAPKKLMRYIVEKGAITINGVSLTVTKKTKDIFFVAVIPFTLRHTNLGMQQKGDRVIIEIDLIARYLHTL